MVNPSTLEKENHARDADYMRALHGRSSESRPGFMSLLTKGAQAQALSVGEYFKHWDNKPSETETEETRKQRRDLYASLTREYYVSMTSSAARLCD